MVSKEELRRQYWRNRYKELLDGLEHLVNICHPYAVKDIKRLTHNLLVSFKNGEISALDYEEFDKRLSELVERFMNKCVKKD